MNRNKIIALSVAIAASGFAFDAAAKRPVFTEIDGDKDGQISLTEFLDMHANRMTPEERFARLDADSNGYLSETELKEARGKRKSRERRE